jgi:hypothetical protein
MSEAEDLCAHCGAPRAAGYAACKYCKTLFVKNTQTGAIPCPRCNTLNELGVQKCVQCQTWVVVQCVFCHALSPCNAAACTKCGEAFAGAPQRFAEQQRAQHLQQGLNIAGTVGNVAASFLGAAAGAGLFSGHSHEGYGEGYDRRDYPQGDGYQGAGIAQTSDSGSSGGGFFDSLFGGSSSSDSSSSDSGDSSDSGGFFDDNS